MNPVSNVSTPDSTPRPITPDNTTHCDPSLFFRIAAEACTDMPLISVSLCLGSISLIPQSLVGDNIPGKIFGKIFAAVGIIVAIPLALIEAVVRAVLVGIIAGSVGALCGNDLYKVGFNTSLLSLAVGADLACIFVKNFYQPTITEKDFPLARRLIESW